MRETAEKFDCKQEHFLPVRTSAGTYPAQLDGPLTALTGMGQGSLTSTPMQMVMPAAGIANNGTVMKPYLVEEIQAPDLSVIEKTAPEAHGQALSRRTAKKVQEMMEHTVREGTARQRSTDPHGSVLGSCARRARGLHVNSGRAPMIFPRAGLYA
ncbi:penicillin-binding transpeptidase domain-containing protein [Streptomyces subrutilus]|uniref:Penicillin-binding protein transpeptidase domain-containing protein n=1 Tax=Streptomyces subrutilus TaxID=36818 RepID=A0A1E5PKW4_9ACTN|nr:hypothetical protein BGK67_01200 [Streptomyces subrutilus]